MMKTLHTLRLNRLKRPVGSARRHSLRDYGKVTNQTVEYLLSDFESNHTVVRRLNQVSGTRVVVIVVVDVVDFDGSFPGMQNQVSGVAEGLGFYKYQIKSNLFFHKPKQTVTSFLL
ncbi:hypothetical protein L6452_42040 [Arctium lappa]|uniref:Uncharacterized protein n=1 Tax=Arctium lappa TaxID=4217 RepID=A0ACB8XHM8_ARCLA|nr:hypothetical protein L6452_42040 [Arctium lappa]